MSSLDKTGFQEMKFLDEFNKKYADSGFSVISVNTVIH